LLNVPVADAGSNDSPWRRARRNGLDVPDPVARGWQTGGRQGVSRLYRSRISNASLAALVLAVLTAIITKLLVSPAGRGYLTVFGSSWGDLVFWLRGIFS
jgi:hypothetical protein